MTHRDKLCAGREMLALSTSSRLRYQRDFGKCRLAPRRHNGNAPNHAEISPQTQKIKISVSAVTCSCVLFLEDRLRDSDGQRQIATRISHMKSLCAAMAVMTVSTAFVQGEEQATVTPRIAWFGTLESGLKAAERSGKPILLISAAPHCSGVSGVW